LGLSKREEGTVTKYFCITGSELMSPATGDPKTLGTATVSPLSPVSPLEFKRLLKRYVGRFGLTFETGDTGEVFQTKDRLGPGEVVDFRGSTP
jgi:hypothetical protein